MNKNQLLVILLLILFVYFLIYDFNKNIFDTINEKDSSLSNYELCAYDCQDRYIFMENIHRCIKDFCKDFDKNGHTGII